jgi:hypothetical protein
MDDMIFVCDSNIENHAVSGGAFAAIVGVGLLASGPVGWVIAAFGAINSVYIGNDGLSFDGTGFRKSLYSASAISGVVGAGVSGALNEYNLMDRIIS